MLVGLRRPFKRAINGNYDAAVDDDYLRKIIEKKKEGVLVNRGMVSSTGNAHESTTPKNKSRGGSGTNTSERERRGSSIRRDEQTDKCDSKEQPKHDREKDPSRRERDSQEFAKPPKHDREPDPAAHQRECQEQSNQDMEQDLARCQRKAPDDEIEKRINAAVGAQIGALDIPPLRSEVQRKLARMDDEIQFLDQMVRVLGRRVAKLRVHNKSRLPVMPMMPPPGSAI
ncbi:uncharacterized protein Z519_01772 [Cladophialophora bantiana CBS 173.52]|uniref:Uncharacterized protein n=1 Tax=Cladophialophora bantiana (strain ATCC 10958 / CBS 173.52 / CDC B-1940 / NIH 8579) TaxID=1442370 RepID=A0A0D2HXQ4_CLAB1|nr:uncharacterized protein Z519_01772 [Cladophialophora bantiana CBS 173.52]KIW98188.1 hypothetical protein Z519_01772 [Cladophialophora bantiana CBS 173.52]